MSLRIRKGTEQQRLGIVFDLGEIIWTTDGEKLYVGDGVTHGGKNIAAQLAGTGLSFDQATGKLQSSATFTTDEVTEGNNNKYFSVELAQDAVWTALQAGQSLGNVTFSYDDFTNKLYANVTLDGVGITSVSQDPSPTLGGNLVLNNHNITGNGDINITGTISALTGLGASLNLNGHDITGSGSISASGTIAATQGLGANLSLNTHSITGTGDINITGSVYASAGLGGNLVLNSHNITGTGNIDITGTINGLHTGQFSNPIFYGTADSIIHNPEIALTGFGVTDGSSGGFIDLVGVKNSYAAPANLAAGDFVGGFRINGYADNSKKALVAIAAELSSSATLTDANPASNLIVAVANGGTNFNFFRFNHTGSFETNTIIVGDGTVSAPSIAFGTDASVDTGFFHPADGVVCIATNAQEKVRVDSGGMRVDGFMKVADVNGTLPNPPEAGMIVLDAGTFKGYNGSAWVPLS